MSAVYAQHYAEARAGGLLCSITFTVRSSLDLIRTALAERRRSSFLRSDGPSPSPRSGDGRMRTFLYDFRSALGAAFKRPLFTALVVGTLGVGIGANTAIFTVVYGVVLRPLPFEEPEGLVRVLGVFEPESGFDFARFPLSLPEYIDYRAQSREMGDVALYSTRGASVTGDGEVAERVIAGAVTPNLFELLGETPLMGRLFAESEGLPDADGVVLLRRGYWHARYAGDPQILGREITIDGRNHTVVGVLPDTFAFPDSRVQLWIPLRVDPENPGNRQSHFVNSVGRLADGATMASATAEIESLMAAWAEEFPEIHVGHYLYLRPLQEDTVRNARPALLVLLGASGFVLLIVCANVASIMLARGEGRGREMAIRRAVGAGRIRLAQLVLGESLLLSGLGCALGISLAWSGVRLLTSTQAGAIPRVDEVGIDLTVLGFAAVTTMLTAVLFSLVPAWQASSAAPRQHLLEGDRRASASSSRLLARRALVTVEVALSFALVLGAGLMIRSFGEITRIDPGFDPEGLLVAGVSLPASNYPEAGDVTAFTRELERRAAQLPGVEGAALSAAVPMYYTAGSWDFEIEGKEYRVDNELAYNGNFAPIAPGFLDLIGTRVRAGRAFTAADTAEAMHVTLVNEELVARFFAGEDPVGERIRVRSSAEDPLPWMTIVGVVENIRAGSLGQAPSPTYYSPLVQAPATADFVPRFTAVVLKTEGDPAALVPSLRTLVGELDSTLPLIAAEPMQQTVADTVADDRFTTQLLTVFAAVALFLGASGIYGVLAYSIAQRTREIGIRKALGAQPRQVVQMVVRQGMLPVLGGLVLGTVLSFAVGRALSGLLHEVSPLDPWTYAGVLLTLAGVAVMACWAPARKAARLDPQVALRSD